jgi:hypothetical protein
MPRIFSTPTTPKSRRLAKRMVHRPPHRAAHRPVKAPMVAASGVAVVVAATVARVQTLDQRQVLPLLMTLLHLQQITWTSARRVTRTATMKVRMTRNRQPEALPLPKGRKALTASAAAAVVVAEVVVVAALARTETVRPPMSQQMA